MTDRPAMCFTPRAGWINDPLGITWDGERYHAYVQYVPGSLEWQPTCHWGHLTSPDLVTWEEHDVALAPGDGDGGIWSGSLVTNGSGYRIFYTSADLDDWALGRIRWADADSLDGPWVKGDVVATPPAGATAYRDPCVFRDGDVWRMAVGVSYEGLAGIEMYRSADLTRWEPTGLGASRPSSERDPLWTGSMWECPQLFGIGNETRLVVSVWDADVLYHATLASGSWDGRAFAPRMWQQLSYGDVPYAPTAFIDAEGRRCLTYWLRDYRSPDGLAMGAMSVPHELVEDDGHVVQRLHPNVVERAPALGVTVDEFSLSDGAWWKAKNVRISRAGDDLVVVGSEETRIPTRGWVQVLQDGPIVEVLTDGGITACYR